MLLIFTDVHITNYGIWSVHVTITTLDEWTSKGAEEQHRYFTKLFADYSARKWYGSRGQ
jgi:hypothetical protein